MSDNEDGFVGSTSAIGLSQVTTNFHTAAVLYGSDADGGYLFLGAEDGHTQLNLQSGTDASFSWNGSGGLSIQNSGQTTFGLADSGELTLKPADPGVSPLQLHLPANAHTGNGKFVEMYSENDFKVLSIDTWGGFTLRGDPALGAEADFQVKNSLGNALLRVHGGIGFFGVTPVIQQPTPTTLMDVIYLLQAYGLAAPSLFDA